MNDIVIFFIGCFVSLIVLAAVGLLLWGAANEPRGSLILQRKKARVPRKTTLETHSGLPRTAERIAG